jgi:hypothetical protein
MVTHYDHASGDYVFRDRRADLRMMRPVFNAVLVSAPAFVNGDIDLVNASLDEGLAPILDFDYKVDFGGGRNIAPRIDALIRQVQAHPGKIAGIWVADQLNKPGLTPDQMLGYLAATGGEFHKRVPDIPIFVDVDSWEITCDRPQQARCSALIDTKWRNQVNSLLLRIYRSGYLDGMFIANNLKHNTSVRL